ncbi:unnamed protein product [Symbiodinium pilosum]|uniref:Uncharacterized protein n=1 Tax=Symbiodinium pilosum TaxID=2952 RepID=A0A812S620_SYMPI|nr:unnamed protein product [Symbiodinium pilosum]
MHQRKIQSERVGCVKELLVATRRDICSMDIRLVAAICSILIGIAHPLCTELAKSAEIHICTSTGCEWTAKRAMPFKVIELTMTSQTVAVVLAAFTVVRTRSSIQVSVQELLDWRSFRCALPIGCLYGLGDLLQTIACNMASAPVVLIVGQSKLFLTALLSKFFLESAPHTSWHKWLRLLTISLAAVAAVDTSGGPIAEMSETMSGAGLALLKAALSSTGAIVSENLYKSRTADFWVVSFHVQSAMLMTSLSLLLLGYGGPSPKPLCPCTPEAGESTCLCATRSGKDLWTWIAVLAIVLNGYATGFFLKHLSAVCKAVCNLASSGVCCLACWICQLSSCTVTQAVVSGIVLLQSFDYALEKAEEGKTEARLPLPTPCRSQKESASNNSEWLTQYGAMGAKPGTVKQEIECWPQ